MAMVGCTRSTAGSGGPQTWNLDGAGSGSSSGPSDVVDGTGASSSSGGDSIGASGSSGGDDVTFDAGPKPDGPSCGSSSVCKKDHPTTPYCNNTHQVCVACLVDFHCKQKDPKKPVCKGGKCTSISCVPGSKACKGDWIEICNKAGDGFDIEVCPDDKPVCHANACKKCKPNEVYCKKPEASGQSLAIMKCNAAGSAADILKVCPGKQVCTAGKCGVCTPGAKVCEGHTAKQCLPDGSDWKVLDDCGAKGLTCLGGLCVNPCSGDFKSNTHVGCDYWAVDLDNAKEGQYDAQNKQFAVVITNTSDKDADVTVRLLSTNPPKSKKFKIGPNALRTIKLPNELGVPNSFSNQNGSNINNRVYNIKATQPIVAYQFNPLDNYKVFSNDASLLLPRTSLGKMYYVMSGKQVNATLRGYFTVLAVEPGNTKVTVVVSGKTLGGSGVPAMNKGQKKDFTLKEGQALNIETNSNTSDLTGSVVISDKRVAVFGGSEASRSPNSGNCVKWQKSTKKVCASSTNNGVPQYCTTSGSCQWSCCADHLEEQMFPVKSWGTTYVAAHLLKRGIEKDTWRVLASKNGTKVIIKPNIGITIPTLDEGKWYQFQTDKDFVIEATAPIQVAQYMASSYATVTWDNPSCTSDNYCKSTYGFLANCVSVGFGQKACAPIGDPSLLLNMATSQYLDDYIFLVPDKYKLNYVTIVAPAGASVKMDGLAIASSQFKIIGGTTYAVARLPIAKGAHKIKASKKVGVWIYGYDDDVSYGYAAGAKL